MIKELIDFVNNKNNVIISALSAIGNIVLLPVLKNGYERRKKISIESEVIYNIDGETGGFERVDNLSGLYSNYVYNEITLKSLNEEVITSIRLTDIKKQLEGFPDIKYDGGFNMGLQKYILIAYNNGDIIGNSEKIYLEITATKSGTLEKERLRNNEIENQYIKPGDVTSKYILDLSDFYDFFNQNIEYSTLLVTFKTSTALIFERSLFFERNIGKFMLRPPVLSAVPIDAIPLFNLSGNSKEVELSCSEDISGISRIGFAVYVDKSCVLSYRVVLKSAKKVIESDRIHELHIRIPKYIQECSREGGIFYSFVTRFNPEFKEFSYSIDDIRIRDKDIIFDKEKAAKKYSNAKFEWGLLWTIVHFFCTINSTFLV